MTEGKEKKILELIQYVLRLGVIFSFILFFAGIIFKSKNILSFGILILIFTPAARILILSFGFYVLKEFFLALSAFSVFILLLISVLI